MQSTRVQQYTPVQPTGVQQYALVQPMTQQTVQPITIHSTQSGLVGNQQNAAVQQVGNQQTTPVQPVGTQQLTDAQIVKDFMDHFMAVAKWSDWGEREMGLQLAICITDEAREVLSGLSCDDKCDFKTLADELTRRFSPEGRESQFSLQLMSRQCLSGEDVTSHGHAIRRLAAKAHPGQNLRRQNPC